jgi:Tyrosine phosphatase family
MIADSDAVPQASCRCTKTMTMTMPSARRTLVLALAVVVALAGGGAVLWHKVVRHHFAARNFGVVEPGQLYRSGRFLPSIVGTLREEHGIRTIIDLGAFPTGSREDREQQAAAAAQGLIRHIFALEGDGTGDPNQYVHAVRLMADPANQPLLVHCATGAQRTSVAVLLYRHLVQGRDIAACYPEAFEYKHDPGDNWRLMAYLADNLDVIEASFATGRPIVRDAAGKWVLTGAGGPFAAGAPSPPPPSPSP